MWIDIYFATRVCSNPIVLNISINAKAQTLQISQNFLYLRFSALFATNNTFSVTVMGNSSLTFNYTLAECLAGGGVGHIVRQSEKGA